jgi:hypothetical protein
LRESEIQKALATLDGRGSKAEFDAVSRLSALGDRFPVLLLEKYKRSGKLGQRASCVYHATKFARASTAAYQLGLEALRDRSKVVRYRACLLLSVAQRPEAIPSLKALVASDLSREDALAAIDALEHRNQHYFVDREHSGKLTLNVSPDQSGG